MNIMNMKSKLIILVFTLAFSLMASAQVDIKELTKAAKKGDPAAQCKMGDYFFNGEGGEEDYAQALEWYKKAAAQDYAEAIFHLAVCYEEGYGVEVDEEIGVKYEKRAAELGNADAQFYLGNTYDSGFGGEEKDENKAAEWYRKAAEQGHDEAQNALGEYYLNGKGVEEDETKAVEWFNKAAEQGNDEAMYNLGECYYHGYGVEEDNAKAFKWYTKAAEQDNDKAMKELGDCYYLGNGVEKDYVKAFKWYTKAAEQDNDKAMKELGDCYYFGKGVEENNAKAVEWYAKASEKGNNDALHKLGVCYFEGYGVEKNYAKALEYFSKAGNYEEIGKCYYNGGYGITQDYSKAVEFFSKAVDSWEENYDAICALGNCYYYGYGVDKDAKKAMELYQKAAELRSDEAKQQIDVVKRQEMASMTFPKGSLSRHNVVDVLVLGQNEEMIRTYKLAKYSFEMYSYPLEPNSNLKTAILTVDVDWKEIGKRAGEEIDNQEPIDWSWSGRGVDAILDEKGRIGITDGTTYVAGIIKGDSYEALQLIGDSRNFLTGLRQGMYLDDLARHIQSEIPGTRVVITDLVKDGLTQYLLLSWGERKVYDVTGDYHYTIHNGEPYFSFWFDKNKRLVKWFKLN